MDPQTQPRHLIFVIGCPGAGKGTLCHKLALHHNWAHISVGDELRKYVQHEHREDDLVERFVRSNELVPADLFTPIIEKRIETLEQQGWKMFLVDGFPRHAGQIAYVQDKIGIPDIVILMECPKDIAKERVLSRKLANRVDNEAVFEKRYTEYQMNNPSIVQRYTMEKRLITVETSGPEEVSFARLLQALPS